MHRLLLACALAQGLVLLGGCSSNQPATGPTGGWTGTSITGAPRAPAQPLPVPAATVPAPPAATAPAVGSPDRPPAPPADGSWSQPAVQPAAPASGSPDGAGGGSSCGAGGKACG
jgi:hypothetical protein